MNLFGRRPNQKRGSRCIVLLIPFFLIFAVLLVLTIVRWPGFDKGTKISNICVTAGFGLIFAVACFLLVRRTRRFYRLGRGRVLPRCPACRQPFPATGQTLRSLFTRRTRKSCATTRSAMIRRIFFPIPPRLHSNSTTNSSTHTLPSAEKLNKRYSLSGIFPLRPRLSAQQENFVRKTAFRPPVGNTPAMVNGNTLILYDQAQEWSALKEKWPERLKVIVSQRDLLFSLPCFFDAALAETGNKMIFERSGRTCSATESETNQQR